MANKTNFANVYAFPAYVYIGVSFLGSVAKFRKIRDNAIFLEIKIAMNSFKGTHYPKDVILYAVFFYVRYDISCRDLEERRVTVDHVTLNRWVIRYSPAIALQAKSQQREASRFLAHG